MPTAERRGDWLQTYSGVKFWPLDPRPADIRIADIAHALAHTGRYNGHAKRFYSVAEHSVLLSHHVGVKDRMWALLHDAGEAYLSDVPRPLKRFLRLSDNLQTYEEAEQAVLNAVAERFCLPWPIPSYIGMRDTQLLLGERTQVYNHLMDWELDGSAEPLNVSLYFWSPETAERAFLDRFADIQQDEIRSGCARCVSCRQLDVLDCAGHCRGCAEEFHAH